MDYLSPTTFIRYLNCEHQVYLLKIKKVPTEDSNQQTLAMATGIAFDIMVKSALNRRFKRSDLLKDKIHPDNNAAIAVATSIMEHYERGPLQALKAEGIGYGGVDQEVEIEWTEPCENCQYFTDSNRSNGSTISCSKCKVHKSVLYGQPDLTLTSGNVIDWKVSGALSTSGAKPIDGYTRCFRDGKNLGDSSKADQPLESIRSDWATQTYLYARLLGHTVGNRLFAGIEYIAIGKDNSVSCCSYRNPISAEFQVKTEKQFHNAFAQLKSGEIPRAHATKRKCIQYNRVCGVAQHCESYQRANAEGRL